MTLTNLSYNQENRLLQFAIIAFWWFFWFLNVIDKIIGGNTFLWVGKDRMAQFTKYFSSIGIEGAAIPLIFLIIASAIEALALLFLSSALLNFFKGNQAKARSSLFAGLLTSLGLFTFFSIGDQIFGDRVELLEHSIFWLITLASWFFYTKLEKQTT